jgi:hypothetical protein
MGHAPHGTEINMHPMVFATVGMLATALNLFLWVNSMAGVAYALPGRRSAVDVTTVITAVGLTVTRRDGSCGRSCCS